MALIKFKRDTADHGNEKQTSVIDMGESTATNNNSSPRPPHIGSTSGATLTKPSTDIPEHLQDDFNWDSMSADGDDEDKSDEGARPVHGFWKMHPLVRALCIMVGGGVVLIIPTVAVLASHRDLPFRTTLSTTQQPDYNLQCVARSFALLTAIWITSTFIYHLVDMIPDAVLRIVRTFKGKRVLEKTKDSLQFFVAIKAYVKMIVMSAVSLVCFVIMFPNSSYRFTGKVENSSATWDQVLFQINVLALFACLIIGGEKLVLKIIATRFHRSAYKERIDKQEYASWVLDHLNRAREAHTDAASAAVASAGTPYAGGSKSATFASDAGFAMGSRKELLGEGTSGTASDIPPPLRQRQSSSNSFWGRRSTASSDEGGPRMWRTGPKTIASRIWDIKDRALDGGIGMNSNQYAGRLARKLFSALHNDRDYLVVDDFLPYFEKEEDAIKAFEFFDKDNNGDISKREMRDRVLLIYKERRALLGALSDMGQVVGKLDMFLTGIALVIIIIIALLVFGLDALKSLATMGTLFVGWSFVFGNTFKTTFECVVFLFQVHAYDVGDTVVVATESLTVDQIRLLSTVFYKTDGTYTVYANSLLATMKIQNLRRSHAQSESIAVSFAFDTPSEKLDELRERMNQYCDDHPRELISPVGFNVDLMENCNRLQVSVGINYKSNWQDGGYHFGTKREFSLALRSVIMDLGLSYHLPVQPVAMVTPPPSLEHEHSAAQQQQSPPQQQQPPVPSSQRPFQPSVHEDSDSDEDIFGSPYRPPNRYHPDGSGGTHATHTGAHATHTGTHGSAAGNGSSAQTAAVASALVTGDL